MLLPVQVTFRNIEDSANLEELVQKEAAKLEQFYDRISSCRVVVERPQRAQSGKLHQFNGAWVCARPPVRRLANPNQGARCRT